MRKQYRESPGFPSSKGSDTSSAIERIKSGRNIKNACLPEFLRSSGPPTKSISLYTAPERARSPVSLFDRARSTSPDYDQKMMAWCTCTRDNSSRDKHVDCLSLYYPFISSIFDPSKDSSDILMRVRQRDLYREDLKSFASGEPLTRSIIDSCLSVIKQLNHDFLMKDEANDKVIIASTELSQRIFNNTKQITFHASTYVMKYE